ncbi:Pkinase-domain-containing protein [Auricularia subglabra TFB-10046 SS5]|nr:Pkinase-domain-containing protein [Auricularia subglabra TFB-10046 SS5]
MSSLFTTLTPAVTPGAGPSRSPSFTTAPPPPPPPAIGKKTSLFFSSPFASSPTPPPPLAAADPVPPPAPHSRASSDAGHSAYQPLTAQPTPPPSVHPDDSLSDWGGSPASSPGVQLARLRSLRAANRARREEDAMELRRAASMRTRAFVDLHAVAVQSAEPDALVDSPTAPSAPGSALGLSALGFVLPTPEQAPMTQQQQPSLPKPPPSPTSPTAATSSSARRSVSKPRPGDALEPDAKTRFVLVKTLGRGAFSSVWLARDESDAAAPPPGRRPSECTAPKRGEHVQGCRPRDRDGSVFFSALDDSDASESREAPLVAVKIMSRALCDSNDRTRVAFVREVEVLRHISHPNIVAYRHAFSTPATHCLVISYAAGGELFDVVSDDDRWHNFRSYRADGRAVKRRSWGENGMSETEKGDGSLLRRVFGELASAVAWMHSVNVVHRDIKLENILLTQQLPALGAPLPPLSTPLVKLADFGLARFVDPAKPLLTTRCGSEAYAAPELLMSGSSSRRGAQDDFDTEEGMGPSFVPSVSARSISSEASVSASSDESSTGPGTPPALWGLADERAHERAFSSSDSGRVAQQGTPPKLLLEPATPGPQTSPVAETPTDSLLSPPNAHPAFSTSTTAPGAGYDARLTDAWALGVVLFALTTRALPFGACETSRERRLAASAHFSWSEGDLALWWDADGVAGAKACVERLLVREPARRARVGALWESWDEDGGEREGDGRAVGARWMRGEGGVPPPPPHASAPGSS